MLYWTFQKDPIGPRWRCPQECPWWAYVIFILTGVRHVKQLSPFYWLCSTVSWQKSVSEMYSKSILLCSENRQKYSWPPCSLLYLFLRTNAVDHRGFPVDSSVFLHVNIAPSLCSGWGRCWSGSTSVSLWCCPGSSPQYVIGDFMATCEVSHVTCSKPKKGHVFPFSRPMTSKSSSTMSTINPSQTKIVR